MTLAVGMVLANGWIADFTASAATFTTDVWNLLIGLVEAMLFAFCAWKLPNTISGLAGGAAVIGFGEAVLGMAAAGGASAYGAISGLGGSGNNSNASNGAGSGGGSGASSGGGGSGGQPNNNTGSQQAAQEMAAKVQTALLKE